MKQRNKLISALVCITMLATAVAGMTCAEDEIIELIEEEIEENSEQKPSLPEYVYRHGHAYVSVASETNLYRDAELTDRIAVLTGENIVVYVDYYNTAVHMWVADQNGEVIEGYISTKQVDQDYLSDSDSLTFASEDNTIETNIGDSGDYAVLRKTTVEKIVYDTDDIIPVEFEIEVENIEINDIVPGEEDSAANASIVTEEDTNLEDDVSTEDVELTIEVEESDIQDEIVEITETQGDDLEEHVNIDTTKEEEENAEVHTHQLEVEPEEKEKIVETIENEGIELVSKLIFAESNDEDILIAPEHENELQIGSFALLRAGEPMYFCYNTVYWVHGYASENSIVKIVDITTRADGEKAYVIEYWADMIDYDTRDYLNAFINEASLEPTTETDYTFCLRK